MSKRVHFGRQPLRVKVAGRPAVKAGDGGRKEAGKAKPRRKAWDVSNVHSHTYTAWAPTVLLEKCL